MAKGPGKGNTNNPAGKPKGTQDRTTREAKELFVKIIHGEIDHIKGALDDVRQENPAKYLDIMSKLYTYVMPRMVDVTSDGDPITRVKVEYIDRAATEGE